MNIIAPKLRTALFLFFSVTAIQQILFAGTSTPNLSFTGGGSGAATDENNFERCLRLGKPSLVGDFSSLRDLIAMQRVSHSLQSLTGELIRIRREKISCTIPELADKAALAIIITSARPNEATGSYHVDAYTAISALELAIEKQRPQHIIQKMLSLALSLIRITAYDTDRIQEGYRRGELSFKDSIYRIKELNRRRDDSDTVLHLAEDPLMMKAFLAAKANPNATNDGKQTPLHYAVHNIDLVRKFLSIPGIHVNAIDSFGNTPLDMIATSNNDISDLLRAHGALFAEDLQCCIS